MFYTFSQNNSGGAFVFEPDRLTEEVIIEADDPDEANYRAEALGIYFDGVSDGRDCECCGDRWYPAWGSECAETPNIYGMSIEDYLARPHVLNWMGSDPSVYVHYKDGRVEAHYITKGRG